MASSKKLKRFYGLHGATSSKRQRKSKVGKLRPSYLKTYYKAT